MKATIIIPTIGRNLENVLKDISEQTYKNYEILIEKEGNITQCMNRALNKAHGSILIRIDDDVRLPKMWLEYIIDTFKDNPKCGGVTGPTIVPPDLRDNRDSLKYAKYTQPAKIYPSGRISYGSNFLKATEYMGKCDLLESCNYAVRTDLLHRIGGFDEKFDGLCEYFEQDAVYKIKKLGFEMLYNGNAYIYHLVSKQGINGRNNQLGGRLKNFCRFYFRHIYKPQYTLNFLTYFLFQGAYYVYKRFN